MESQNYELLRDVTFTFNMAKVSINSCDHKFSLTQLKLATHSYVSTQSDFKCISSMKPGRTILLLQVLLTISVSQVPSEFRTNNECNEHGDCEPFHWCNRPLGGPRFIKI